MWERLIDMLGDATLRTAQSLADFLPGLVGLLVILLGAAVAAIGARLVVLRGLRGLDFDRRAERLGLGSVADWSLWGGPSLLAARVVMWTILVAGLLAGLSALDAALPEEFARALLTYIPRVLAALLILVLGTILAQFLARTVLISAVNVQLRAARLLSAGVRWLLLVLTWVLALEHLGIGRGLLALAFAILFGGIVLAAAIALGLGTKDLVHRALEPRLRESGKEPDKISHL